MAPDGRVVLGTASGTQIPVSAWLTVHVTDVLHRPNGAWVVITSPYVCKFVCKSKAKYLPHTHKNKRTNWLERNTSMMVVTRHIMRRVDGRVMDD